MSSNVLVPQVASADRGRGDSKAVDDDIALSVRNVDKMYYLYDRPQDRLKQAFLWGRKRLYREFWALRDVSFKVRQGEALGVIGGHGTGDDAGGHSLLKDLAVLKVGGQVSDGG